jgi:hypothetical protein
MRKRWSVFIGVTILLWLLAHSVAFFCHEFSHSFVAYALGWKKNPLALNWGSPSALNLLLHVDVDENVDYGPIFLSGHPYQAGFIALAGLGLGNAVISLSIGLGLFAFARNRSRIVLESFGYWLVVMSIGNLISYVPLRVFTSHADMHTAAVGFGWTPEQLLVYLGVPILLGALWFFLHFQPRALRSMFPESPAHRSALVVLTSVSFFGWFAMGGFSGYGDLSHKISLAFMLGLTPLSIWLGLFLARRSLAAAA